MSANKGLARGVPRFGTPFFIYPLGAGASMSPPAERDQTPLISVHHPTRERS